VLSEKERSHLLAALKKAEVRIRAGKSVDYDPRTFKKRLLQIYPEAKR
jgi:hypothetical protein